MIKFLAHHAHQSRNLLLRTKSWFFQLNLRCLFLRFVTGGSTWKQIELPLYGSLLRKCTRNGDLLTGFSLHCDMVKRGDCVDMFDRNILLHFYVSLGFITEAVSLFEEMLERNTVSYVTLMQGFVRSCKFAEAMAMFSRMNREGHELNGFVFSTVLKLLVSMDMADLGCTVHACLYKLGHCGNPFIGTSLIDAYSVCGCVGNAKAVFDEIIEKDMVCWTGMVSCYAENEYFKESMMTFSEMRLQGINVNNYTFVSVLKACTGMGFFDLGQGVHGLILRSGYEIDLYVAVGVLEIYSELGSMNVTQCIFEEMPKSDAVTWSFMITQYAQRDCNMEACNLFVRMRHAYVFPNNFTYASVLQACAGMQAIESGKQIHSQVIIVGCDSNVFVSNALMDMYAKCGMMDSSFILFKGLANRNDVSWNTMIVGFALAGDGYNALTMLISMLRCRYLPSEVTYTSALRCCASLASLEPGNQIHAHAVKTRYDKHSFVSNSLIDMYAKCGSINDSRLLFDKIKERDEVSWNAMIAGYSMHGLGRKALSIFELMKSTDYSPSPLTFVGVLAACSNAGLLNEGKTYFELMIRRYGIEPCMEHYTCMVSLLGRTGHLDEAVELINKIPFVPSVMVWRALLGACVIHKNLELGKLSAEQILHLEPQDDSAHVLLSNIYASARRWRSVASVRKNMKSSGVRKEPGLSWIENQGTVHYFFVGDTSHSDMKVINGILEWFNMKTKRAGYAPDYSTVLLKMKTHEKARRLWVHSERLALAFGVFRSLPGSDIRIIKNLRVCSDCHTVFKLISKIVQRHIIVRDMNRFHHFQDGVCSCGDYW